MAARSDTPLSVVPYSGFAAGLTRAPYVTDLTQTSAYINWATTSNTPGSVQVEAEVGGICPSATSTWSDAAQAAPTSLPGPVNATSTASSASLTGWQFTVNGDSTTDSEYQSSVPVTGLSPGTAYCYAVFSSDQPGAADLMSSLKPVQSFTTLDPPDASSSAPLTFDVIADTGENYSNTSATAANDVPFVGGVNPDEASLYQQIGQSGAKFLLMAGDIAYSGGNESNYGDLEQTGTQPEVSNIFGPSYFPLAGGIPTFAADGNHGQTVTGLKIWPTPSTTLSSNGTYAFDSFNNPADGISGTYPDDWYAFSTGNVRVYMLDASWIDGTATPTGSECTVVTSCPGYKADSDEHWQTDSPEYQWLQRDLAAYPGGVKVAIFHFPLRSVNATQPSDPYLQNSSANPSPTAATTSLEALLAHNGVKIAFNGHAHTYQRIEPSGPNQVINYVTGGGGGVLEPVVGAGCTLPQTSQIYALGWNQNSPTDPLAGSPSTCGVGTTPTTPTSAADVYNFLKVTVSGTSVTVDPTNAAGHVFDAQTYSYPASPQPSTPTNVTATLTTPSTAQVTWSPSTVPGGSITSYQIARNGTTIATVPGTATSFTDNTIQPATSYVYRVTAVGSVDGSSWPGTSNAITTLPPNAPVRTDCMHHLPSGTVVGAAAMPDGFGYYEVDAKGDVAAFGGAPCYGALTGLALNKPIVGMAYDPVTGGYWLVASDGGVFAANAPFYGSTGAIRLNKPIVGIAADPATGGYWLVASDGGVFSFNAPFRGSTGSFRLNKPVVGMAVDTITGGYWLVASDGGVFSFDAPFHGSTGSIHLNSPVVGIEASAGSKGYRLIAADGGVFNGHAPFWGSAGSFPLQKPVVAGINDDVSDGYWLVASDGGVFSFHAPFFGSAA